MSHPPVAAIPPALKVAICGGGNGAHVAAAFISSKPGIRVRVLTRRPGDWSRSLTLDTSGGAWDSKGTIYGTLDCASDDPEYVVGDADVVIVAAPSHTHITILKKIADFLRPGCLLGTIYAQGAWEWAVRSTVPRSKLQSLDAYFGLQNIPWICRTMEYGKKCQAMGPKKQLWVACSPPEKARTVSHIVSLLFDIPTKPIANFLSLVLTPSNQIIHPGRYVGIFGDWDGKKVYRKEEISWGLYTEVDDISAMHMSKLDDELQSIRAALQRCCPALDLSSVMPLGERIVAQYGTDVADRSSLKQIFRTNLGYAGCITPATAVPGGFIPALKSRLFLEDVPSGLCVLKGIAQIVNTATPHIDFMIEWHQKWMDKKYLVNGLLNPETIPHTVSPQRFGIHTVDGLVEGSVDRSCLRSKM